MHDARSEATKREDRAERNGGKAQREDGARRNGTRNRNSPTETTGGPKSSETLPSRSRTNVATRAEDTLPFAKARTPRGTTEKRRAPGRCQPVRRIVVLGHADPVEAQLLNQLDPFDHSAIGLRSGLVVIGIGRHRPFGRQSARRTIMGGLKKRDFHDC
jgi:hypothetical protein